MLRYGRYGENMQYNKKYCPAIVGIYYYVDDVRSITAISKSTGIPTGSVQTILERKYHETKPTRKATQRIVDAIEREYLAGESTYMLAEKYGVDHTTIGKWMKKRGHSRGKGWTGGNRRGHNKGHDAIRAAAMEKCAAKVEELTGGSISLVSYVSREDTTLRCNVCGHVFKRYNDPKRTPRCPRCYEKELLEIAERREQRKEQHRLDREAEYAKEKHCKICGRVFHSKNPTTAYCSDKCRTKHEINRKLERDRRKTAIRQEEELKKDKVCICCGKVFHSVWKTARHCDDCHHFVKRCDHKWRAKKYGVAYEPGITVKKLVKRDNNICQICGKPCDGSDKTWGSYGPMSPSVDHIIAMVNGGGHVWENVQLAHVLCNAIKGACDMSEVTI